MNTTNLLPSLRNKISQIILKLPGNSFLILVFPSCDHYCEFDVNHSPAFKKTFVLYP